MSARAEVAVGYRKVMVGVDGSETAKGALMEAAEIAAREGSELLIVSSYEPPDVRQLERWQAESPQEVSWRLTGTTLVEEVLKSASRLVKTQTTLDPKTRYEEGDPAEVLITVAQEEGVDLIVVGSKGMTGAKRFLLGSVPNKVSHHAPCDLLIVKTTD